MAATAPVAAQCPRCSIQRPFYCDCEDTFDVSGASLTVAGLGKIDVRKPDDKGEYFVLLKLKSQSMNFTAELELPIDIAHALARKLESKAREMEAECE